FYPIELTRAISSAILKGSMQYLATNAVRSEDQALRNVIPSKHSCRPPKLVNSSQANTIL
ncbi:hypothetical protein N9N41_07035, partial [Opitutales bacterium]|nr:hypothetical protein [Opitutales bacterium]